MRKLIVFCIVIAIISLSSLKVNASSNFYEGEYIDGIYMNKRKEGSSTIYYQKARFFRQTGTNRFAYCIDPFVFFQEGSNYDAVITPSNLTESQKQEISLIAYFGYGYNNHTEKKWYAITQMMIWKAADLTGNFYFTDKLNGNKIEPYNNEINEINTLIANYKKETSLNNKTYTIIEGETLSIEDNNKILSNYKNLNPNFLIQGNKLIGSNLTEGEYLIDLIKEEKKYQKPLVFYQSNNSQALMQTGDLQDKFEKLKVKVLKTQIEITKVDKDTKSTTPSGEGILTGAIYSLLDKNYKEIKTLEINKDNIATIQNIPLGTYYIQEKKAGVGYKVDTKKYKIELTEQNHKTNLILENEIIKKKIIIYKTYGENNKIPEPNISFSIYDSKNQKIATITTDKNGIAEITLPYGKYKIIQENTTKGYHKVKDIKVEITNDKDELIKLVDYKIKVPNTKTNFITYLINLILNILNL
ncbi:MAG: SpaA isopeptide-forming pilin-related protein [bacterium]|nr:SpaA isopeptide-forming pilin-related protein [bacterium]